MNQKINTRRQFLKTIGLTGVSLVTSISGLKCVTKPKNEIFDGRSFLPQMKGEKGNPREWVFCHYNPQWGNRTLKRYVHDKKWKLYHDGRIINLQNDPLEQHPVSMDRLDEKTKDKIERFQSVLDQMKYVKR